MTTPAVEELVNLIETARDDDVEAPTRVLNITFVSGECLTKTENCIEKLNSKLQEKIGLFLDKNKVWTKTGDVKLENDFASKIDSVTNVPLSKDLIQSRLVQLVIITQLLQKSEQSNPSTDDIQEIHFLLIRMLHLLKQRLSPEVNIREVIQDYVTCNYNPDILSEAKLHIEQRTLRYILMIKIREMLTKWRANIWFCELQAP